jgi:tryptophan halogenase
MDITICGGGTAGWIAAFHLLRASNIKKLTVIESSKVGIIGAGEASSGLLYSLLEDEYSNSDFSMYEKSWPKVDLEHFNNSVEASPKYGIFHKDWAKKPGGYFGPIIGSPTEKVHQDFLFLAAVASSQGRKGHTASEFGIAYDLNAWPISEGPALHFDGNKFSKYIRDFLLSYENRLNVVDATIDNVNLDSRGWIESVNLDDGSEVKSDFWFDATGFKKVLMSKMGTEWTSYKDVLPVDSAIPFIEEYQPEERVKPMTLAQAMSSGWMWNSPLDHRKGAGYVYSSQFVSDEDALKEVEEVVGHEVDPIKTIKFESGRISETWKNNCIAIGLASSFLEPLEATSIHSTIVQMIAFTREYLTPTVNTTVKESYITSYNERISKVLEHYKDFTVFHYQGGRTDSEFWRYITNEKATTPVVENYIEKAQNNIIPGDTYFNDKFALDGLWKWTLSGLDLITPAQANKQLKFHNMYRLSTDKLAMYIQENKEIYRQRGIPFIFLPRGAGWER